MKKLTITVEYTEEYTNSQQLIEDELKWIAAEIEKGQQYGYNEGNSPMGEVEVVTTYKIEEVQDGE